MEQEAKVAQVLEGVPLKGAAIDMESNPEVAQVLEGVPLKGAADAMEQGLEVSQVAIMEQGLEVSESEVAQLAEALPIKRSALGMEQESEAAQVLVSMSVGPEGPPCPPNKRLRTNSCTIPQVHQSMVVAVPAPPLFHSSIAAVPLLPAVPPPSAVPPHLPPASPASDASGVDASSSPAARPICPKPTRLLSRTAATDVDTNSVSASPTNSSSNNFNTSSVDTPSFADLILQASPPRDPRLSHPSIFFQASAFVPLGGGSSAFRPLGGGSSTFSPVVRDNNPVHPQASPLSSPSPSEPVGPMGGSFSSALAPVVEDTHSMQRQASPPLSPSYSEPLGDGPSAPAISPVMRDKHLLHPQASPPSSPATSAEPAVSLSQNSKLFSALSKSLPSLPPKPKLLIPQSGTRPGGVRTKKCLSAFKYQPRADATPPAASPAPNNVAAINSSHPSTVYLLPTKSVVPVPPAIPAATMIKHARSWPAPTCSALHSSTSADTPTWAARVITTSVERTHSQPGPTNGEESSGDLGKSHSWPHVHSHPKPETAPVLSLNKKLGQSTTPETNGKQVKELDTKLRQKRYPPLQTGTKQGQPTAMTKGLATGKSWAVGAVTKGESLAVGAVTKGESLAVGAVTKGESLAVGAVTKGESLAVGAVTKGESLAVEAQPLRRLETLSLSAWQPAPSDSATGSASYVTPPSATTNQPPTNQLTTAASFVTPPSASTATKQPTAKVSHTVPVVTETQSKYSSQLSRAETQSKCSFQYSQAASSSHSSDPSPNFQFTFGPLSAAPPRVAPTPCHRMVITEIGPAVGLGRR
eukprot:gene18334-24797_t